MGPIGASEFEDLSKKGEIVKAKLYKYVDLLIKEGILEKEKSQEFKNNINEIFGEKVIKGKIHEKKVVKFFEEKEKIKVPEEKLIKIIKKEKSSKKEAAKKSKIFSGLKK